MDGGRFYNFRILFFLVLMSNFKFSCNILVIKYITRQAGECLPCFLWHTIAYYICLNDYVRNVLPYREHDYKCQESITIYIPEENVLKADVAAWYGKRAKLYGLFQELLTLADNVRLDNVDHKVNAVEQRLKIIVNSDAWSVCKHWPALEELQKQLKEMLENNMINETCKHLLDRLAKEDEDPSTKIVYYENDSMPISALLAAQSTSCDAFLDCAKAISAGFENHIRHMWLPTQTNWLFTH